MLNNKRIMNNTKWTDEEISIMLDMKQKSYTDLQIGEVVGRTAAAVSYKLSELRKKGAVAASGSGAKPATLSDFSPRDMIKYLYNLGYRIENNQLVFWERKVVNIKDVVEG